MASKEINLLQIKQDVSPDRKRWTDLLFKVITPFLIFYVVVIFLIIGINIYLDQQINSVKTSIDGELAQIASMKKNEGIYMLLKQKASAITTILQNRFNYGEVYSFVDSLNQKGGKIISLAMSEAGNVTLSVNIPDTQSLDDFTKALVDGAEKRFNKVQIGGISYKPGSNYVISFTINAKNVKTN